MMGNYVAWAFKEEPHALVLDQLSPVEKPYQLMKGIPRAADFPSDVTFTADPDFPNDTVLVDVFTNTSRLLVISPRLKDFLEARSVPNVEYLPITLLNHKRKPAAEYFILHPIHPVECLDVDASEVAWDPIDKKSIRKLKQVVIDEAQVDPALQVFKPKFYYRVVIVRRDLAEAITAESFTGIKWTELKDHRS